MLLKNNYNFILQIYVLCNQSVEIYHYLSPLAVNADNTLIKPHMRFFWFFICYKLVNNKSVNFLKVFFRVFTLNFSIVIYSKVNPNMLKWMQFYEQQCIVCYFCWCKYTVYIISLMIGG